MILSDRSSLGFLLHQRNACRLLLPIHGHHKHGEEHQTKFPENWPYLQWAKMQESTCNMLAENSLFPNDRRKCAYKFERDTKLQPSSEKASEEPTNTTRQTSTNKCYKEPLAFKFSHVLRLFFTFNASTLPSHVWQQKEKWLTMSSIHSFRDSHPLTRAACQTNKKMTTVSWRGGGF